MTCRTGVNRQPILTARAVAFPEPSLPPSHVPDLADYDPTSGMAPCKRCHRMVSSSAWAGEPCPGKAVA